MAIRAAPQDSLRQIEKRICRMAIETSTWDPQTFPDEECGNSSNCWISRKGAVKRGLMAIRPLQVVAEMEPGLVHIN